MTDLKQEISRIQKAEQDTRNQYPGVNKWYEITKIAYERGELIKLLSADEEYIYDSEGRLWLRYSGPDWDLGANPIDIRAIVDNGLYELCTPNNKSELKQTITNVFNTMLDGTPEQVYFATELFYALADDTLEDKYHPFEDIYKELAPIFTTFISENPEKLKAIKIYNCKDKDEGLYKLCEYYSNEIVKKGGKPFVVGVFSRKEVHNAHR